MGATLGKPFFWFQQKASKWPLLIYACRLGILIDHKVLVLSIKGRKTGKEYKVPMWYVRLEQDTENVYCLSRRGSSSQWVKNILADPVVSLKIGRVSLSAKASIIRKSDEVGRFLGFFQRKYGTMGRLLLDRTRIELVSFRIIDGGRM